MWKIWNILVEINQRYYVQKEKIKLKRHQSLNGYCCHDDCTELSQK